MCVPSIATFYKHGTCPFSNKFYTPHTLSYKHTVCVFPSTPTFYAPATCYTLRVPFDTHVFHTCYMSYTACSLRHPRFTHLLHVIPCVFPSTPTCDCSAQQLRQQLRGTLVATQWRVDTALTFLLFSQRSTTSSVFRVGARGRAIPLSSRSPCSPPAPARNEQLRFCGR